MPAPPVYPGISIQEISSDDHTIVGVATSITAFIGRTKRGPAEDPITVDNYESYERVFGGLWDESTVSFAVRDFFLNGGRQAIIVRLFQPSVSAGSAAAPIAKTRLNAGGLELEAANPGKWGNNLRARIDHDVAGTGMSELFNLSIIDGETGLTERFSNLSIEAAHARRADIILQQQSELVRVSGDLPSARPSANANVPPGADPFSETCSYGVAVAATDGELLGPGNFYAVDKDFRQSKQGLYALEKTDLFNLLCIPPFAPGVDVNPASFLDVAAEYCSLRRAMLIADAPAAWTSVELAKDGISGLGTKSKNAALYFPRLRQLNPLHTGITGEFAPCGAVAGIISRTDAERGVWKAPAGTNALIKGITGFGVTLDYSKIGELNPLGINCLRSLTGDVPVVWGARTLEGDDRLASEWKYIPVRRTALFIEESICRGTQWAVFEPNNVKLWVELRHNIDAFMTDLFRQGAFQGTKPNDAFLIKCDHETTTQTDIDLGFVNILVGFAPLKPAEFIIIKFRLTTAKP